MSPFMTRGLLALWLMLTTALGGSPAFAGFRMPDFEKHVLANGLTIYLMPQSDVPLISVTAAVLAGSRSDGEREGLAYLTAQTLALGTQRYPHEEFDRILELHGVELDVSVVPDAASFSATFAAQHQDKILDVLSQLVMEPQFPAGDFSHLKTRLAQEVLQAKDSPRDVIGAYFNRLIFGRHPYGNAVIGNEKSLQELDLADVRSFYRQHYGPANTAITVVGDFKIAPMKERMEKLLGGWKQTLPRPEGVLAMVPALTKEFQVLLVDKPDAQESTFLLGGAGVSRSLPQLQSLRVVNATLGGKFTSWLMQELRFKSGLSYGASSNFRPLKDGGTFVMSTFTKTATTIQAIDKTLEVYHRFHEKGPDDRDMTASRTYLKGQFPPDFETSAQLATLLSNFYIFGLGREMIDQFEQQVDTVTAKQAHTLIRQYFPREALRLVVIGKASEIREALKKYGPVREIKLKEPGFGPFP